MAPMRSFFKRSVGFVPRLLRCAAASAATAPRRLAFATGSIYAAAVAAAVLAAMVPVYAQSDDRSDVSAGTDTAQSERQKVAWREDAHEAMADARKSGKLALFDVGASWCPNCKKMQETTYTDPAVCSQLNQNFICVQLDKDDQGDGTKLCDALFILALPTVVIVDPQTDKYMMKVGYQDAAKFAAMIAKVQKHGLRSATSGFRLTPKVYGNR